VSNLLQPSFGERYLSSALFAGIKEEVEKQSFEAWGRRCLQENTRNVIPNRKHTVAPQYRRLSRICPGRQNETASNGGEQLKICFSHACLSCTKCLFWPESACQRLYGAENRTKAEHLEDLLKNII
jgi:hypothetical protein